MINEILMKQAFKRWLSEREQMSKQMSFILDRVRASHSQGKSWSAITTAGGENSFIAGIDWAVKPDVTVCATVVVSRYGYKLTGAYTLIKQPSRR